MPWGQVPPAYNDVFDRHCMFPPLVVVAVLKDYYDVFFLRVVIEHPCSIQSRIKDSG